MSSDIYLWIKNHFLIIILLGIFVFMILNIIFRSGKDQSLYRVCMIVAGVLYTGTLFYVTLGMRVPGVDFNYELALFWSYRRAFETGEDFLLWENFANVAAFIPMGMFMEELGRKFFHWYACVALGGGVSVLIEVTQLLTKRGLFEFDDILHNTLGALLGVGIAILTGWLVRPKKFSEN